MIKPTFWWYSAKLRYSCTNSGQRQGKKLNYLFDCFMMRTVTCSSSVSIHLNYYNCQFCNVTQAKQILFAYLHTMFIILNTIEPL